jgi:hypothetical protein
MDNWYAILRVSEAVTPDELEHMREEAQREHHPDLYAAEPSEVKAQHAAQLATCLEGVAFLLSENGPKVLKDHLRQQCVAQAAAAAEAARQRNAEEARQRADADDLRAQFGAGTGPTTSRTPPPRRTRPTSRPSSKPRFQPATSEPPRGSQPPKQEPASRPTPGSPYRHAVSRKPPAAQPKPTSPHSRAAQEDRRRRIVTTVVVVGCLIGIIALASSGTATKTSQPPSKTPQQVAADKAANAQSAAESRIAELSFMCIDGRVCQTDPVGHALGLFIYGVDENLQRYLQEHGYTDEWSDNAGYVHGHALSASEQETEGHVAFVRYRNGAIPIGPEAEDVLAKAPAPHSGLMYSPESEAAATETNPGLIPTAVPSEQPWMITWRLKDATGRIVKELPYSLEVISCPESTPEAAESEATPCASAINEEQKRAKEVEEETGFHEATNKYYQPAPPTAFNYP